MTVEEESRQHAINISPDESPRPGQARQTIDPNDPEARERQRTMDVDLAMQMSRARRDSVNIPISGRQQSGNNLITSNSLVRSSPEPAFSLLSPHEEEPLDWAMSGGASDERANHDAAPNLNIPPQLSDAELLFSLNQGSRPDLDSHNSSGALPMYQPAVYRSNFDYSHMEEFGIEERRRLGISSPARRRTIQPQSPPHGAQQFHLTTQADLSTLPTTFDPVEPATDIPSDHVADHESSPEFTRLRQRKLSQSNTPAIRRGKSGKLALFEGNVGGVLGAPPPSLVPAASGLFLGAANDRYTAGSSGWGITSPTGTQAHGHDRPYRFSFYSNSLAATIHARSLSELPAEGQTFEDLFAGKRRSGNERVSPTEGGGAANSAKHPRGAAIPTPPPRHSRNGTPGPDGLLGPTLDKKGRVPDDAVDDDWEGNTWWLDILDPTDDEMRMLSQVFCHYLQSSPLGSSSFLMQVFSIHPLTTEDIQIEEAREKIELFRNYYLVCFRSFDQDQYSPTYLEPVNMYILVFREGTLSVRFHVFRLYINSLPVYSFTSARHRTRRMFAAG